jgi:hypothetical protein
MHISSIITKTYSIAIREEGEVRRGNRNAMVDQVEATTGRGGGEDGGEDLKVEGGR